MAQIKGEAFFRSGDRAMGHSSPLTVLNRHDGNKFAQGKRLFKQSPTSVLLKWPIDVDPPKDNNFHKVTNKV